MTSKRPRKSNYSQEENLFLADKYEEYKDVLDAKHKDVNTNRRKREAWESVLEQHRARFPHVERTLEDLKTKLSKLKMDSRDCLLDAKKMRKETGGGKPPKEPNAAQQKILDMCEDTPGFSGLTGGIDSAAEESYLDDGTSLLACDNDGELITVDIYNTYPYNVSTIQYTTLLQLIIG